MTDAAPACPPDHAAPTTPLAYLLQAHMAAAFDYLEFRCVVEGEAARLAAERASDEDRALLTRRFQAIEAVHADDDPSEEADADAEFHLAIYEAAHNLVLLHIMQGFSSMLRNDVFYSRNRLYTRKGVRELLLQQHRAIYDAVMARDPAAAAEAAAAHMRFTRDTLAEINAADDRLEASLRRIERSSLVEGA
jgi:GntR family transcriptional regulator, transcriptional repressor for pyruvate dehydrogenase complex